MEHFCKNLPTYLASPLYEVGKFLQKCSILLHPVHHKEQEHNARTLDTRLLEIHAFGNNLLSIWFLLVSGLGLNDSLSEYRLMFIFLMQSLVTKFSIVAFTRLDFRRSIMSGLPSLGEERRLISQTAAGN